MDYLKQIKQTALLSSLSDGEISNCISDSSFITNVYRKNSILHFPGEVCSKLEIILTGRIVAFRASLLDINTTHSTWWVQGNWSTGWTFLRWYPPDSNSLMSLS